MPNFNQVCQLKTDFTTKAPLLEVRENENGKFLCGKIQWLDGKDKTGKLRYQWLYFFTSKEDMIDFIQKNSRETLRIEGWLKIQREKDDLGKWKVRPEIRVSKASLHVPEVKVQHWQND